MAEHETAARQEGKFMDSVLSGYSQSYSGAQIGQGQGYAGTVGMTGGATSGSGAGSGCDTVTAWRYISGRDCLCQR